MMETDDRPQLPSSRSSPNKNHSVLILNQTSAPCAADKCNGLSGVLQRSLSIAHVQEEKADLRSDSLPFVPDLILLRIPIAKAAQKLIHSCKRMWSCAALLALFCFGSNEPIDILPSV